MAKKKQPSNDPRNELRVPASTCAGVSRERLDAEIAQDPVCSNAQTARIYCHGTHGTTDLTASVEVLREKVARMQAGDLSNVEAMLFSQAVALNSIAAELFRRAALNMGTYLSASDTYLRNGFKAMSQSRATLETLAAIKNPPVVYARQANIANGPQQVNNAPKSIPRTGESGNTPTQLSGASDELLQNARASGDAGGNDSSVEAVGVINWPKER